MSVILEAKHISKNFGLTQALKDVSVTIPESQLFPLLFPEFIRNLKESLLWTENHINQQTHWMHRIMESV